MQTKQSPLLNQNEVAEMIGVKPRTLEDWRITGAGPRFIRISKRCVRYQLDDVLTWVDARSVASTAEPIREAA